jgi:all-trans-retinol 13,14-reductase
VRGLAVAGGGNAGAGVEAVVISGAEAAEALLPGTLAGGLKPARTDAPVLETV